MSNASIYEAARYYDIAFSYRDYAREADVLLAWHARATGGAPQSALELAAGPARHAIELAGRGIEAWALDLLPAMAEYARGLASQAGVPLHVVQADMTDFSIPRKFDLALIMIDSANHILTAERMIAHLRAVGRHLLPGGVYIMELSCPQKPGEEPKVLSHWTQEKDGIEVEFQWGKPGDKIGKRIQTTTVEVRARTPEGVVSITEQVRTREWTRRALDGAIKRAGCFGEIRRYGAFEPDAPFDNTAWRMIYVMRRVG
jgi:SAM-dependent methyltransferase